jgi:thiamine-monophosphate kinase
VNEFDLIRTYFAAQSLARPDVQIGIGDDAAIVRPPPGTETVITTDVLVEGVHFFPDVDPAALGHKSLAVNLSDLAAMGAAPAWFLLNLTLPEPKASWLQALAKGMFALACEHQMQLIGGDTSRGPLAIGITAIGLVPDGTRLLRSGARPGDAICVTGALGDAALALAARRGKLSLRAEEIAAANERLDRPVPRVRAGMQLRDLASSAIDVSDGLLADLGHVLEASAVGARLTLQTIPLSSVYRAHLATIGWGYALAGGDDYELCVTIPRDNLERAKRSTEQNNLSLHVIGEIVPGHGIEIFDGAGQRYQPAGKGYNHFAAG